MVSRGVNRSRRGRAAVVAAATLLMATPSVAGADHTAGTARPAGSARGVAATASWTVLHYSMSDTDLEPSMMVDVNEMGEVGSNEHLNIVALVDRSPGYGEVPVLDIGDWVGAKLVHVQPGHGEVLADLGSVDMGDPATLASFITDGITAFPADHYAVIISDHGASWPGLGPDEGSDYSVLDLADLQSGLADGLANAGVERLDLLGMDACLMASYEVASALAPYADRLIASSETEPGSGWDYRSLQLLADNPQATVDEFGIAIVDSFLIGNLPDTTLALLDLTQMAALDDAMAAFSSALVERTATVAPDVGRTLAVNPGYGKSPDPTQNHYLTDLGTLAATIGIEALDVSDQADAVQRALNDVVVHKGSGAQAPAFSGLSIYFPPSIDVFNQAYAYAAPNPSGWIDFLESYYTSGQAISPSDRPAFGDVEPAVSGDSSGLTIEGTLAAGAVENLATATIRYGFQTDEGSVTYLGDEPASIADDGSGLISGFYDLTVLTISDGVDTATAYVSISFPDRSDGFDIDVPMLYYPPGWVDGDPYERAVLSIAVDGAGDVIDETYYAVDEQTGSTGELYAEPEGIVVPRVLVVDSAGNSTWTPTSDVGLYADLPNLVYAFEPLPIGTPLVVTLEVSDFGANSAAISTVVEVP